MEPWHRLPRGAVESPSLKIFKPCLDKVLCSLLWVTLLGQGVELGDSRGPFQPLPFCDSVIASKKRSTSRSAMIFQTKIGGFIQLLNLSSVRALSLFLPPLPSSRAASKWRCSCNSKCCSCVGFLLLSSAFSVISRQIVLCVSRLFWEQPILCLSLRVSFRFLFFICVSSQWVPVTNCNVSEVFIFQSVIKDL